MAAKPSTPVTPGLDIASIGRGVLLALPAAYLFGWVVMPVLLLGLIFIRPLIKLRTRLIGPPLMNQGMVDERNQGLAIGGGILFGGLFLWAILNEVFPDDNQRSIAIIFLVIIAALVWVRPSMAVTPLLVVVSAGGSWLLLIAAPLVVMLARRDQRRRLKIPRSIRRTAMTLIYALAGLLVTLPFANFSAGSPRPRPDGEARTPESPTGDGSLFDQITAWLLPRSANVDTATPSRPIQVPGHGQSTTPPDETNWLLWIAIAIGVAALLALAVWFRRRRRRPDAELSDPNAALTLARLEAIGAAVGRRRAANEGALTFASKLAAFTGDTRLDEAGSLVSGDVYGSNVVEPQHVATQLAAVESNPPPPPPTPPLTERLVERVRSLPISRRGLAVSTASLIGMGALVWFVAPSLGDLRQETDRELAYVEQDDAPDEWHRLLGTPPSELIAWESCSSGYEDGELGWVAAGLLHRTEPLGAEIELFGSDRTQALKTLRVGDDAMHAAIGVEHDNARLALIDEPWRINEWTAVTTQPFLAVDDVLSAAMANDPIRTDYVDRNGDIFARYESLPPTGEDLYGDDRRLVSPLKWVSSELMRVVDVWTDDAGLPMRVRLMTDGPDGRWTEWRRLDEVGDARLTLPSCAPVQPWANSEWIGAEAWTPSRKAPLQIVFDDEGNPYDSYTWAIGEVTAEPSGTIDGPIDVLSFGDLTSISPEPPVDDDDEDTWERPEFELSFDVQWGDGAEVTLIRTDGWPMLTRITAVGETVATWDELEPFYIYESFATIASSSTFPILETAVLDELIEPLWEGGTQISANLDDEPGDELTVLTQSDAGSIVAGRNERGEIVALVVWEHWEDVWRQYGFEGAPPPSVAKREAQLRRCIAGEIEVELSGRCPWEEE